MPALSAVVQMRGSIPLFWQQDPSPLTVKPRIQLQHFDPLYAATARHFADLQQRYGHPVVREGEVGEGWTAPWSAPESAPSVSLRPQVMRSVD